MRLTYHPAAEAEVIEAAKFYETRVAGLGGEFLAAVDEAVRTIKQAPDRWRIIERDIRRYVMPRFPFAIYYRLTSDEIRILTVKHHSRHPDFWRARVDE